MPVEVTLLDVRKPSSENLRRPCVPPHFMKTKLNITIDPHVKRRLALIAALDKRSLSNMITVLVNERYKKTKQYDS
jgi:predicted HicB family RNase H-like nuclease